MEKEIVKGDGMEVGFSSLELKISRPSLAEDGSLLVEGNFSELSETIKAVVNKYSGLTLTEENVPYVKSVKTQFQRLRTGIEMTRKEWKKVYITSPGKLLDSMCDALQNEVAKGETHLDSQLKAYDQKRKDELTVILKGYIEEMKEKYALRDEYSSKIVLKEKYYNVTQKEEDSVSDIEAQAETLAKEQKERDMSIALIKAECEGTTLVADTYLTFLAFKSPAEVLMQIHEDKEKAKRLYEERLRAEMEERKAEEERKEVVGKELDGSLKDFFSPSVEKETLRERTILIRYRPEMAEKILDFFIKQGIEYKILK